MTRGAYNLYIDESGSFGAPGQPSVVCGILEDASAGVDWDVVRREMAHALPLIEYPFHACVLNVPTAWLAAVLRHPHENHNSNERERQVRRACARSIQVLQTIPRGQARQVDAFRAALAERKAPDQSSLNPLASWLRDHHPACLRELAALRDQLRMQLTDSFRHLFQPYRFGGLVGLAALAHPDESKDVYTSEAPSAVRLDGYVRALETLLERALCVLRGPGQCQVELSIATRHVHTRGFGTLDFGRDGVQQIATRAKDFPRRAATAGTTRDVVLTCARGIVRYDAAAPMGLVLADFLSNRLFHQLRGHSDGTLATINEEIAAAMSLPLVCAPSDPQAETTLPTICADGLARARVREAYQGQQNSRRKLTPRWNREQAGHWIDFATGLKRGPHAE